MDKENEGRRKKPILRYSFDDCKTLTIDEVVETWDSYFCIRFTDGSFLWFHPTNLYDNVDIEILTSLDENNLYPDTDLIDIGLYNNDELIRKREEIDRRKARNLEDRERAEYKRLQKKFG